MTSREPFIHKTSLGQNFLVNPEVIRRSLEAAQLGPHDVVLEVGPGQGVLSRQILASSCSFLHGLEIDNRLAPWLEELQRSYPQRFRVTWGDAMALDLRSLAPSPNKMVANIPYNITTPLIWKALEELAPLGLQRLVLLIQKEAADRLTAPPRTKERYPLGITLELMGSVHPIMKVSPGSFNPPPKVFSTLVAIEIAGRRDLALNPLWRRMLRAAFSQRRKKLVNNLATAGLSREELEKALGACGISTTARAEELTASQWFDLCKNWQEGPEGANRKGL